MGTDKATFEVVELPEVTSPKVTSRKYVLRFFLLTIVVQATWLPEVTKGLVTPSGVPLGVRVRNRKLGNIRPSGAF